MARFERGKDGSCFEIFVRERDKDVKNTKFINIDLARHQSINASANVKDAASRRL